MSHKKLRAYCNFLTTNVSVHRTEKTGQSDLLYDMDTHKGINSCTCIADEPLKSVERKVMKVLIIVAVIMLNSVFFN